MPTRLLHLAACVLAATPAAAETLAFTTPDGVATAAIGQCFIPGVAVPGAAAAGTARLLGVTFPAGGVAGVGADRVRLALFPAAYPDLGGFPRAGQTLGLSTERLDTRSAAAGEALAFTFRGVDLPADEPVAAVFVTTNESGVLEPVATSLRFVRFDGDAPAENPGGEGNFDFAALYPDADGDGFPEGAELGRDLAFTLTFAPADASEAPAEPG